ncbi:DUF6000 family protein [Nonomuraea rhizosphaerae]|uniref:DUF6000 family protein n=1 Tax=Nonomuraea rhizosphaerae TaxID=2665663 RepID=UPI001C5E642D|nr:DUF6000 family protein [Nonomuraea rhizosphaerae]
MTEYLEGMPLNYRLIRRYVRPGKRYLMLMGMVLILPRWRQRWFQWRLRRAAARISRSELEDLLSAGWRERFTAAWLAAVARRTEMRERIGALLLASEVVIAGEGYCFALARFGTADDAELLVTYLRKWLPRIECDYDQGEAMAALLYLDARLGADRARQFLGTGGPWERWADGKNADLRDSAWLIEQYMALADGRVPLRPPPSHPAPGDGTEPAPADAPGRPPEGG